MRRWLFALAHGLAQVLTAVAVVLVVAPYSRLSRLLNPARRPRVLWGPVPIFTIELMAAADRMRGLTSHSLVYDPYHLSSAFTYIVPLAGQPAWKRLITPYFTFLWALWHYDVFQYYYDKGYLTGRDRFTFNRLELPLLKLAGKASVFCAYGADMRYRERCEQEQPYNFCMDCPDPGKLCVCDAAKAKANYAYVQRWGSQCLSTGDMTDYTPGSRNDIPYLPIDLTQVAYHGVQPADDRPVRIVHAPNHRHFKGTRFLLESVEQLQAEGWSIELDLVEKLPNQEAKKRYAQADIIADQFIGGFYGYFAVEAMAMGKPVVCFIRERYEIPPGPPCPIVSANPDQLTDALRRLVASYELRQELGQQGRAFVEANYDLPRIGARMAEIYETVWGRS